MEALGFEVRAEASLLTLTQDAIKTRELEGEFLSPEHVRSSVARRLGLDTGGVLPTDQSAEATASMLLDATQDFRRPLTEVRLLAWHRTLFPAAGAGLNPITVGLWRTDRRGRMIVASGHGDRERVQFEAPAAARVPAEMNRF